MAFLVDKGGREVLVAIQGRLGGMGAIGVILVVWVRDIPHGATAINDVISFIGEAHVCDDDKDVLGLTSNELPKPLQDREACQLPDALIHALNPVVIAIDVTTELRPPPLEDGAVHLLVLTLKFLKANIKKTSHFFFKRTSKGHLHHPYVRGYQFFDDSCRVVLTTTLFTR